MKVTNIRIATKTKGFVQLTDFRWVQIGVKRTNRMDSHLRAILVTDL